MPLAKKKKKVKKAGKKAKNAVKAKMATKKKTRKLKKAAKTEKTAKLKKVTKIKKEAKKQKPKKLKKTKAAKKTTRVSTKKKPKVLKKAKKSPLTTRQSAQYEKTLKKFGQAVREFNRRGFAEAKERFLEIIKKHSQEQELAENARTYIKICDKNLEKRTPRPKELDDFYNYGIMQLNNENYKEAIKFFDKAISFDSKSEKVLYAKAAAYALSGNKEEAFTNLKAAIKNEPQNRIRAKTDPDFDSVRTDSEFNELIEPFEEIE